MSVRFYGLSSGVIAFCDSGGAQSLRVSRFANVRFWIATAWAATSEMRRIAVLRLRACLRDTVHDAKWISADIKSTALTLTSGTRWKLCS